MPALIVLIVIGFLAQLVDGALGMAYGATSSTLLLAYGLSPATASASVHLAELGTTAVSLVAAVPAVMAFNYFARRIKVLGAEMDGFTNDFLNIVKRHFLR